MDEQLQIKIERRVYDPEFYLQNFLDDQQAADFLGVDLKDWLEYLKIDNQSLSHFLCTMRLEDVLSHLCRDPEASLRELAAENGFRTRMHLLWHFYKRHHCTPRAWALDMGLIEN